MKNLLALLVLAGGGTVSADTPQEPAPKVTIVSKGRDVREVLTDIFAQAKRSCIIQPNIHFNLYLSLENTDFDLAVAIICKHAGLESEDKDGISYLRKPKPATPEVAPTVQTVVANLPPPPVFLPDSAMAKKVTTRLSRTSIRKVMDAFAKQAGVKIEVDQTVPEYKLDAFLTGVTLKYALEHVTKAASLTFRRTDHATIEIDSDEKVTLDQ